MKELNKRQLSEVDGGLLAFFYNWLLKAVSSEASQKIIRKTYETQSGNYIQGSK